MPVPLYMDVRVPRPVTDQLRRRGIDVLTAIEDGCDRLVDEELLDHACTIGCVLFTQDIRFKAMAEEWQRTSRTFAGLVFGHPLQNTIGQLVNDLELIAKATDPIDWLNTIQHLPL